MENLIAKIKTDLITAMRSKDENFLSTLRMLIAALKNKKISLSKGADIEELTGEQVVESVQSEIRKRKDSISAYAQGNRQDLVEKEEKEIEILKRYLPEQLSDEEIEKVVIEIINAGATEFGKVMGQAMAKLKGKVDGNKVSEIVKRVLAK
ncbi:MAG: GatB/YqeY domain-containing protein [Candidatus Falkowbacteria bacterium]|nr:GatB/YqeY domain-containing protein [Candidatus Falkowbacteria bacterium]